MSNITLISVGTELLTSKTNTTINYIAERLASLGLGLKKAITVSDDQNYLTEIVKKEIQQNSLILITGGLGPTFDDITVRAVAAALDKSLTLNRQVLSHISKYFLSHNQEMPKSAEQQAYMIEGARVILNSAGTAPGQIIELTRPKCCLILLPGPPAETAAVWESEIHQFLEKFRAGISKTLVLHLYGLSEPEVDNKIRPIIQTNQKQASFTILYHLGITDIRITVRETDELLADDTLHKLENEFRQLFGQQIYGINRETLEAVVGQMLVRQKKTLAVAESCTGGLLATRITNVAGSSLYFLGGIVAYSNRVKKEMLEVDEEILDKFGAVSKECAAAMAGGLYRRLPADYCLSITGYAGPAAKTDEKPIGLTFVGLKDSSGTIVESRKFSGNRLAIREQIVNLALNLVYQKLQKIK